MPSSRTPQLLDLIAVLQSPPDADVEVVDVGTVVKLLPPHDLEVEFLDRDGRIRCLATPSVDDVLVLNRKHTSAR